MNWVAALGLAMLLVSMGILAWVVPDAWRDDTEKGMSGAEPSAPLNAMIRQSRSGRRLRTRRIVFVAGAALLLTAVFLILQAPQQPVTLPPIIVQGVIQPVGPTVPTVPLPPSVPLWEQPLFWITVLLIVFLFGLGVVLVLRSSPLAGSASLIAAATLSFQLVLIQKIELHIGSAVTKELVERIVDDRIFTLKSNVIEDLNARIISLTRKPDFPGTVTSQSAVKLDLSEELKENIKSLLKKLDDLANFNKIDVDLSNIDIETKINTYLSQIALAPERLGDFTEFKPGKSDFRPEIQDMQATVDRICQRWQERTERQEGLLIVVGATDRMPLGPSARGRYESNFGLARARAEEIKSKLRKCGSGIDDARILAIVSGPRSTPEKKDQEEAKFGHPKDRMVDVWAIWSWREPPAKKAD
jgi:flagellar motor protein MotB